MFCTQCGYAVPDGSTQCTACGAKLAGGFAAPPLQNPYLSPPQVGGQNPYAGKPDNFLAFSIISTVMCCPIFGIVAIVYSSQVDQKWFAGDHEGARRAAKNAKTWSIVALCTWVLVFLVYMVFIFFMVSAGAMNANMRKNQPFNQAPMNPGFDPDGPDFDPEKEIQKIFKDLPK